MTGGFGFAALIVVLTAVGVAAMMGLVWLAVKVSDWTGRSWTGLAIIFGVFFTVMFLAVGFGTQGQTL